MSIFLLIVGAYVLKKAEMFTGNEFNREYISQQHTKTIEGILALLVIFSQYTYDFIKAGQFDAAYVGFQKFLGQGLAAIFLFYSGYGMMSRIDSLGMEYIKSIPRKFLRLYGRFTIGVILFVMWRTFKGKRYSAMEYLQTLIGWKSIGNNNWYVFIVLCMYICLFLAFIYPIKKENDTTQKVKLIVFSVFVFLYAAVMREIGKEVWWYNTVICFVIGAWYYKLKGFFDNVFMRSGKQYVIILALLCGVYAVLSILKDQWLLYYELWVILLVLMVQVVSMKVRLHGAVFDFLGEHVFGLYMIHRLPMMMIKNLEFTEKYSYSTFVLTVGASVAMAVMFDKMAGKLVGTTPLYRVALRPAAVEKKTPSLDVPSVEKQKIPNTNVVPKATPIKKKTAERNPFYIRESITRLKKSGFLFAELVKRDFKQKYKRTVLGMWWSVLSPLLTLLVMRLVFTEFFGRNTAHYTTYLFCGNLLFSYFRESTTGGMNALMSNRGIITKINVPKYLFLLSKNVSALINFGLTLCVFFIFAAIDKVTFSIRFITLLYPIVTFVLFNIGIGLILSALFVFFRDIGYLYEIFTLLLMYLSAIFYNISSYPAETQKLFLFNPVYCHILYFRTVVLDGVIPDLNLHLLCLGYALAALIIGGLIYKKNNHKFLYYM